MAGWRYLEQFFAQIRFASALGSARIGRYGRALFLAVFCVGVALLFTACGGGGGSSSDTSSSDSSASSASNVAAVPGTLSASVPGSPWLAYYGSASAMGSLATVAATFHIMDLDLDPGLGNFSPTDVATLKNGGGNLVLSYLNIGSCESFRTYWTTVSTGFVSCNANTSAQLGSYSGYANETWMNPANADYQNLIVNYVAPRLVAQGADGFFLDNMEIVEHGTATRNGPCDAACAQGGLDIVRLLRAKYPSLVIVMQNAAGTVTRLGTTGGVSFASLLDGISHESVYAPSYDSAAESQLLAWQAMQLTPNGHPFWIATLDYVGSCSQTSSAQTDYQRSRAKAFVPYASNSSSGLNVVCYWGF